MAEGTASTNPPTSPDQAFVVDNSEAGNMSLLSKPTGSPNQADVMAEGTAPAAGKEDQPRTFAPRACLSCRRLKMKCVVESGSSCARCLKAGRQCEFPQPGQTLPSQPRRRPRPQPQRIPETASHVPNSSAGVGDVAAVNRPHNDDLVRPYSHGLFQNSYNAPSWTPITPEASTTGGAKKSSELPSVHSASPLATIVDETRSASNNNVSDNKQLPLKRRRTGGHILGAGNGLEEPISERDMEQLVEIFQERILRFIPILGPEDFGDISTLLIERKALVQCVCYVTARFVPGGSAIRDKLFLLISDLLLGASETQKPTASHSLALLQGLIVLYAYAQAVPTAIEGAQSPSKALLYWRIKAFTEAHATQLFLHRSIEGLKTAVAAQEPHISTSYCYKMYTYWLWLYTMSHHGSLATRTPPSIRADASIRAASKLLNQIGMNAQISQLLGEVELCLSWEQTSIQKMELGEWWCQPEPHNTDPSNRHSVDEIQAALNRWTHRWSVLIASETNCGSGLDFHIRFTQFCITTYSIRPLDVSADRPAGLLPAQKEAIANCVEAASQVLAWALDLGPASKDRLRYLYDFGFVMLSFCGFFILQAFQAFGSAIPQSDEYLDTVAEAAQLMTELAMDSKHAPAVYGRSILLLLEKVKDPNTRQSQLDSNNLSQGSAISNVRSRNGTISDTQGFIGHNPSSFVPDQTWDFTSLFPDMLWN